MQLVLFILKNKAFLSVGMNGNSKSTEHQFVTHLFAATYLSIVILMARAINKIAVLVPFINPASKEDAACCTAASSSLQLRQL
jgi:hypothetical protein